MRFLGERMGLQLGKQGRDDGFTLIEMVISAAIMTIILAGAYLCLNSGFRSQKLVETRADIAQSARVALAMICADLRCAKPLSKDIDFLGMQRTIEDAEADNLDFGTCNYHPKKARESDFCEVSYFVSAEPKSGQLSLWRRRDPTPDDEPLAGGVPEEIARGVRELRLEYYDGLDWFNEWGDPSGKKKKADDSLKLQTNLSGLPEAVRVTLTMGSARNRDEAPMTFQTVCRLNLAGLANAVGDSATSDGADAAAAQPGQNATPGGAE
jgi:type II secretion system protein J